MTKSDLPERPSKVIQFPKSLPPGMDPPHNGGDGGGGDDMEKRIAKIEADQAVMSERVTGLRDEMGRRFDSVNQRLDEIIKRLDRAPTQWDMAKIVFTVVAALMAAAIWGPRALALLGSASQ